MCMKALSKKQTDGIDKFFDFYDFDQFQSTVNHDVIIEFNKLYDNITYNDLNYGDNREIRLRKESILKSLFFLIVNKCKETSCIIRKYNECWVANNRESKKLQKLLRENNVKNRNTDAILTEKNTKEVDLFISSCLKYNSFVQFLLKEEKMVMTITDHMDLFISFESKDSFVMIKECIQQINNRYYTNDQIFEELIGMRTVVE